MAHVVPKREPCVKCNNPVFLAERLQINQSLYHRTCFRCARCNSVLTLGNFYETEKDHEYCCETCPDEEKATSTKVEESNRLSIAQKIALFEKESSSVLKKSLSDEEKSKSLNRQPTANAEALNGFLTTQIQTQEPEPSDDDEEKTADSLSSDSESEDEESPPTVPSNHPTDIIPSISDKQATISDHKVISETPDNSVVTKELTRGKDIEAIANVAATNSESQKDIESAHVVVVNDKKVPDEASCDEFELEFEKLAEDAVKSPIVSMPFVVVPTPTIAIVEDAQEEKVKSTETTEKASDLIAQSDEPKVESSVPESSQRVESPSKLELSSPVESSETLENAAAEPLPAPITEPTGEPKSDNSTTPNPFEEADETPKPTNPKPAQRPSLNPFGSCSEDEDNDYQNVSSQSTRSGTLPKPPRPPPPKAMTLRPSTNPFGSDDDDDEPQKTARSKTPVPTPRKPFIHSMTPEPTPRSLSNHNSPGHSFKGSTSSLSSSTDGMSLRRRKKKAPAPPPPVLAVNVDAISNSLKTPSTTPRKKRPAPTPPTSTPKPSSQLQEFAPSLYITASDFPNSDDQQSASEANDSIATIDSSIDNISLTHRRLIPLEESLIEEGSPPSQPETEEVTYRRKIVPLTKSAVEGDLENLERSKDNKEAQNRQRQSQGSLANMRSGSESTDSLPYLNKSSQGKWKRRKGPAPALPGFAQPQRRILQMLPLQDIRHELEVIEVQQQGLEKQGVMLEKMIRERCEGSGDNRTTEELLEALPTTKNPKEVEELILQLFELVNEKNELFRRQAELMYLRRAHRLEEEQADVEYEIRTLMAQPEQNKTDTDKAKEEALIARLVEIVQLRSEVVDNLDRDRLREAEEDLSIKQRMESHTAKLDQDYLNQTPTKLSKKEKKKLKEAKKLKNKKLDADKDLDTSEIKSETSEKKKKKKKFLF